MEKTMLRWGWQLIAWSPFGTKIHDKKKSRKLGHVLKSRYSDKVMGGLERTHELTRNFVHESSNCESMRRISDEEEHRRVVQSSTASGIFCSCDRSWGKRTIPLPSEWSLSTGIPADDSKCKGKNYLFVIPLKSKRKNISEWSSILFYAWSIHP
jgi:hypothetical protein